MAGGASSAAAAVAAAFVLGACVDDAATLDVVVISLDTVRGDVLRFDDESLAPNLCALAKRGVVFEQAVTGSSWTLPTHAQLFTGEPPVVHGVQTDRRRIDPLTPTLPELLRAGGWFTAGVWSGWYLSGAFGFERGFVRYAGALEGPASGYGAAPLLPASAEPPRRGGSAEAGRSGAAPYPDAFVARERASHAVVSSERVVALARELLEVPAPADRVFLFAHFFDPHFDYVPPPPYDERFDPDYTGEIDGRDYWDDKRIYDDRAVPPRRIGERDLEHVRALYRGEIAWTDAQVGELLGALEAAGRLERALIVVLADHGEEFFEHGDRGHRRTLFEEVLHVPLLIVPPGAAPAAEPRRVADLVSLSDVMPTILDYARIQPPASVHGRSLRPLIEGDALEPRAQVASLTFYGESAEGAPIYWRVEALRAPDKKLVRRTRLEEGRDPVVESVELFDLARDPGERVSIQHLARPQVMSAWRALEAELEALRSFHAALPHSSPAERSTDARALFASELAGLGYVGSDPDPAEGPEPAFEFSPLPPLPTPH